MKNHHATLTILAALAALSLPLAAHNLDQKSYKDLKSATKNFAHASSKKFTEKPASVKINGPMPRFQVQDVYGKKYSQASFKGHMALFVLADTQCPCVQAIDSRLGDLGKKYAKKGLKVYYIFSKPDDKPLKIARFMQGHRIPFPAILDQKQVLLRVLDGQCSSEVYLFDKSTRLRYHGRVDDSTFDPKAVKKRDLENAIVQVSAGQKVAKPEVPAMGCAIPRIKS